MRDAILNEIRNRGAASFVNLQNAVEGFKGDREMYLSDYEWVYWIGISSEAIEVINSLQKDRLIELNPCHLLIYMVDGEVLKLPLVRSARKYKKPHWMPVTFSLMPAAK